MSPAALLMNATPRTGGLLFPHVWIYRGRAGEVRGGGEEPALLLSTRLHKEGIIFLCNWLSGAFWGDIVVFGNSLVLRNV